MSKKLDPRVRRTRQLLRDALVALIDEQGYEKITVQDITQRATLNRATFYLHYRDKLDLLYQSSAEILQELVSSIQPTVREKRKLIYCPIMTSHMKHLCIYLSKLRLIASFIRFI